MLQSVAFMVIGSGSDYRDEVRRDKELPKYLREEKLDEIFRPESYFSASKRNIRRIMEALHFIDP